MEGPIHNVTLLSKYLPAEYETLVIGGTPLPHEAHCGKFLGEVGIEYVEIPEMGRFISPFEDWKTIQKVRALIREFQPDIVHSHTFSIDGIPARIAVALEKGPIKVHTFHGHVFDYPTNGRKALLARVMEKRLCKNLNAVIAISDSQRNDLVNTYHISSEEKTHTIPLGIHLERFQHLREEKRTAFRSRFEINDDEIAIGIIARLAPIKNHKLFLDALHLVAQSFKKVRAFIIGDGELAQTLTRYARDLSLYDETTKSKVIFTSWITQIDEALAGLDIVALTSYSEGTPVSVIEAQASGIPVVATDVGGVKNCIIDGKTGILTESNNAKLFSNALLTYCNNPFQRIMDGKAGHKFVLANFSHNRLVRDIQSLYEYLRRQ